MGCRMLKTGADRIHKNRYLDHYMNGQGLTTDFLKFIRQSVNQELYHRRHGSPNILQAIYRVWSGGYSGDRRKETSLYDCNMTLRLAGVFVVSGIPESDSNPTVHTKTLPICLENGFVSAIRTLLHPWQHFGIRRIGSGVVGAVARIESYGKRKVQSRVIWNLSADVTSHIYVNDACFIATKGSEMTKSSLTYLTVHVRFIYLSVPSLIDCM
jgi:hypothetical protein